MSDQHKIGLALSGGAVLGAAHVGVLRALDEQEIQVEFIAGTSIGAFVGTLFAFGKNWKEISDIASQLDWIDVSEISISKYGLLSNKKIGNFMQDQIGEKNIEDARIPLAFVATDVTSGEKVVLDKGPVSKALMASTCIPGIFNPVEIEGRLLVDGGVVENVPVKTSRQQGASFIIGVDLNGNYSYEKPDNILEVIINSFHFTMKTAAQTQTEYADLLIQPDLSKFSRSNPEQIREIIERGYHDALRILKDKSDWRHAQ